MIMAKKDFASDLQNFVKKAEKESKETPEKEVVKAAGRPREHDPYEKTTVTFPSELMGKLRMLCLYDDRQIREVLQEALEKYINEYEEEHGAIRVPPRFRENKK